MEDALCVPEWDNRARADEREASPRAGAGREWVGRLSRARGSQSETEPAGCREPEVKAESVNRPRNSQMNWRFIESAVHAAIL